MCLVPLGPLYFHWLVGKNLRDSSGLLILREVPLCTWKNDEQVRWGCQVGPFVSLLMDYFSPEMFAIRTVFLV